MFSTTNAATHPIRAVILDFGMVLCHAPSDAHLDRVSKIFGIDHRTFWRHYDKNRLALDRGDISPDDYWIAFAKVAGLASPPSAALLADLKKWDMEMWLTLNDPMLDWVERLHKAGYKLALLSNLHQSFADHLRGHAAWLHHFHVPIFSAEVRRVKPEPEIYRHVIEKLGVPAGELLFIDDRQTNIDAAREHGIHSLLFTSIEDLRSDLAQIAFTPLP
jgi:putative hydrolase of the HAD superfamily